MKKPIVLFLLSCCLAMTASAKENVVPYDGFICQEKLSYDGQSADLTVAFYATESKADVGDGDMYTVTIPTKEIVNYPLGTDVYLYLTNSNNKIKYDETVTNIVPCDTMGF